MNFEKGIDMSILAFRKLTMVTYGWEAGEKEARNPVRKLLELFKFTKQMKHCNDKALILRIEKRD